MRSYQKYYLLVLFCALTMFSGAQQAFHLKSQTQSISISPAAIEWLIDKDPNSKLETIKDFPFFRLSHDQPNNLNTASSVWTRLEIINETGMDEEFVLRIPKLGLPNLYIQNQNHYTTLRTGSLLALKERSIQAASNGFRFALKNNQQVTLWLQMKSVYSIYVPRNYDMTITTLLNYEHNDKQRLLWQGIFLGVILVMFLYNLFTGIAVQDINYLYYVLSIAGIGLYFAFYYGIGIEYLWKNAPYWDTFCFLLIVPFNGLTRLLFTRTYLHTPKTLPRINFLMNVLISLNLLLLIAGILVYVTKTDIINLLLDIIGISNTSIHCLMLIAGIVAYYKEKYQPAKFFIWANVVLVIGAVLFIGRELAVLEDNFATRYLVQIGFLIQVVVFSLGLTSRLNNMRSQLAKETLEKERLALEKEREKKELIDVQRRELELRVQQQTADLKQKNIQLEQSFALVKESENKQTQLNQIKDKLFSIISHDLRNPLATMQSFLTLITEHHEKLTNEEKEKLYVQAQQSLDHLNELMYNLLQWSRSQMNLLDFKQEKFYVKPLIENSAKLMQLNAHLKDISIKIDADENLCGYADKSMTEFVIRNLISNAIKFSYRNNEVAIKASRHNGSIIIEVKDSGVGMTDSKIRKLLEMNTTISRRGTEKEKGTGLGLLISKEFIEKNKGKLLIKSEPGKGSEFSFSFQSSS